MHGGDLIWEIGSGYFGCRTADGRFDPERFAVQAQNPQVRMIEIKMSQGAKPGHGGILPKHKVTQEIADTRGILMGEDCISPSRHSAFSTPIELMHFIQQLRELSGGKPVGFKFCLGHPWEFMGIAKAMLETGILPDFIVVDGKEGGTGAAPVEFTDHIGVPLREGLLFVHNTLVGLNLRDKIKLGASGKIVSAFDIASVLAIGADWANSARGFMFAIGCIQSQSCHTNKCPTGVATQDALRQRALVVPDKAQRVYNFHRNTLKALAEMLAAAGLAGIADSDELHGIVVMIRVDIRPGCDGYGDSNPMKQDMQTLIAKLSSGSDSSDTSGISAEMEACERVLASAGAALGRGEIIRHRRDSRGRWGGAAWCRPRG